MCNHKIIFLNEKNRSKLVILQSFSALCYIFRKWEHFQITKFNGVHIYFWDWNCPPNFLFQCSRPHTWHFFLFFLLFPFQILTVLSISFLKGWVGHVTHCCKRPICRVFVYSPTREIQKYFRSWRVTVPNENIETVVVLSFSPVWKDINLQEQLYGCSSLICCFIVVALMRADTLQPLIKMLLVHMGNR